METRKISDLVKYDKNPRNNEAAIEHVLQSLRLHGQVKPIVISEKGKPFGQEVICCGHTTFEALQQFGAQEVKVVVKGFRDENEFVDLNIRDNKTGEFATWDDALLQELGCAFDLDMAAMGFTSFDDVDYSILDDEDDSANEEMASEVKKSIQIEFDIDDYEEAKKIVDKSRKAGVYIGGKLIEVLSAE